MGCIEVPYKFLWLGWWQGWAILEDFIAIQILGGQNCRELVNFLAHENFIGKNLSEPEKPIQELLNIHYKTIAIHQQFC